MPMKKFLTLLIIFAFGLLLGTPPSESFFVNNMPTHLHIDEISAEGEAPLECEEEESNFNQGLEEEERHLSFSSLYSLYIESSPELFLHNLPDYKEFIPGIILPPPELA